ATTVDVTDSITVTVTGVDEWGNNLGDITDIATITSSHASDIITGDTVYFPSASIHTITAAVGAASSSADITVRPSLLGFTGIDPSAALLVSAVLTLIGVALTVGGVRLAGR